MLASMTAAHPTHPLRLHRHRLSGHSHRAELMLALLGLPYELVDIDLVGRAHKGPDFLAMNAFGQIPVLKDGDVTLADSNAILVYLAGTYGDPSWLPRSPLGAAAVQRWLSVAAGQLAHGPAAARLANVFGASPPAADLVARSHALLAVVQGHLESGAPFLAADHPTIADVALYTYVAHAPEGGVSLADYPAVRAWLGRIEALPGFVPMVPSPVGLNA
jgi:glutathione S-transferase